ncbi:unnamed protein product [Dimorphilus gyrociliatus]|uniref:Uncharacterized protein n=1 Tax=Dimorphilus gyrociliatus TaxID=2664684 RepID=A0A7I8VT36_9ANNE|nr:unnamed protein product [Dimorphilus gyrociliatus]
MIRNASETTIKEKKEGTVKINHLPSDLTDNGHGIENRVSDAFCLALCDPLVKGVKLIEQNDFKTPPSSLLERLKRKWILDVTTNLNNYISNSKVSERLIGELLDGRSYEFFRSLGKVFDQSSYLERELKNSAEDLQSIRREFSTLEERLNRCETNIHSFAHELKFYQQEEDEIDKYYSILFEKLHNRFKRLNYMPYILNEEFFNRRQLLESSMKETEL